MGACNIGVPGGQACTAASSCMLEEANVAACTNGACAYAPLGEPIACNVAGGPMQIDATYAYVAASAALWRWRDGVNEVVTGVRGAKVSEDVPVPAARSSTRSPRPAPVIRATARRHSLTWPADRMSFSRS